MTRDQVKVSDRRVENRGSERGSDWSKGTQLVSGRAGIRTQVFLTLGLVHFH